MSYVGAPFDYDLFVSYAHAEAETQTEACGPAALRCAVSGSAKDLIPQPRSRRESGQTTGSDRLPG